MSVARHQAVAVGNPGRQRRGCGARQLRLDGILREAVTDAHFRGGRLHARRKARLAGGRDGRRGVTERIGSGGAAGVDLPVKPGRLAGDTLDGDRVDARRSRFFKREQIDIAGGGVSDVDRAGERVDGEARGLLGPTAVKRWIRTPSGPNCDTELVLALSSVGVLAM